MNNQTHTCFLLQITKLRDFLCNLHKENTRVGVTFFVSNGMSQSRLIS